LVKRRNWLIATATALFVLQGPFCAIACLPSFAPDAQVAETHHESSCHGQAPSSKPSEPADSHDDCGCENSYTAILASPDQTFSSVQELVVLPPHFLGAPREAVVSRTTKIWPSETDLPPPNVLLLKSTLLI
jgi:hypothetical protein